MMESNALNAQEEMGCFAYENWKAALDGEPLRSASEYPLFTDTRIIDQVDQGYGPYKLLNAVPTVNSDLLLPYLVLRIEYHGITLPEDMRKTNYDRYHGGGIQDEIAALVALCLGIRLKPGGITRFFDVGKDPKGYPTAWELQKNPVLSKPLERGLILPYSLQQRSLKDTALIAGLPDLSASQSIALIRAAKLYQDAMWVSESEPELSWLLFVSAVETAAGKWRTAEDSPVDKLRASRPELEALLMNAGGEELLSKVANQIVKSIGATKKFTDFIMKFLPSPPVERPPAFVQVSWSRGKMRDALSKIYDYRSHALHGGIPFPAPMCWPPGRQERVFDEAPSGLAASTQGGVWVAKDTPMLLHVFEYIVRHALLNWWQAML